MLRNLYFSAIRSIIVALTVQLKFWLLLLLSCLWIFLKFNTSSAVHHIYLDAYLLSLLSLSLVLMYKRCYCISKLRNLELLLISVTWRLPYEENKEASEGRGMHGHAREEMTYKSKISDLYWSRNCTVCWMEAEIIQREPWYPILECNHLFWHTFFYFPAFRRLYEIYVINLI